MSGPGLRQQHVLRSRKVTITGNTIQFRSIVMGWSTARHPLQLRIIRQGMVHDQAPGGVHTTIQINCSQHCFESIHQQTLFASSAGTLFPFAQLKKLA